MKSVQAKSWSEYFKSSRHELGASALLLEANFYYKSAHVFSKFMLYLLMLAASLFAGLNSREGLVVFPTLLLFGGYLYFLARSVAYGLQIKRKVPPSAQEGEVITVEIQIENRSSFTAKDLVLFDSFEASLKSHTIVCITQGLASGDFLVEKLEKTCDGGMGIHYLNPIGVRVTDPLGIFEFWVTENDEKTIEVYPKLESLPQLEISGSQESFIHGLYEVQTRGGSLNFAGIRDYTRGDSLRHIAWRPSTRNSKLLVKEFERVVDSSVSIFLDLNGSYQYGSKSKSTWEYAKKIALGLASQQITNGNQVQVISNRKATPLGRGNDHYYLISSEIYGAFPEIDPSDLNLIERYIEFIPQNSVLIYIGTTFHVAFESIIKSMMKLSEAKVRIIYILIDAYSFCSDKTGFEMKVDVRAQLELTKKKLDSYTDKLFELNVSVHLVQYQTSITQSLLGNLV